MADREKNALREAAQWIIAFGMAILIVLAIKTFLFQTTEVKGVSMEPGLVHGEVCLINKVSAPERQDVIVCAYDNGSADEVIIKRVIGMPGDVIDIEEDFFEGELRYRVKRNGEILQEDYVKEVMQQKGDIVYPFTVPEGCYFVMGDNRNFSSDSRMAAIGAIQKEAVVGKAVFILYPFSDIRTVR